MFEISRNGRNIVATRWRLFCSEVSFSVLKYPFHHEVPYTLRCSVSLPVVLLLKYVFAMVLFHGITPAQHHIFRMIMWALCIYNEQHNRTTGNLTEHFSDFTQGDPMSNEVPQIPRKVPLGSLLIPYWHPYF